MKRRGRKPASGSERLLRVAGLRFLEAIRARAADPNRIPPDVEVSFIPSANDVLWVQQVQRRRRAAALVEN